MAQIELYMCEDNKTAAEDGGIRQRYRLPRWEDVTIANDVFFGIAMGHEDVCKLLLECLLDLKIDRIEYIQKQKELSFSADGKAVRLDVYLKTGGRVIDVEMQVYRDTQVQRRIRYYQSAIDTDQLLRGMNYKELPESLVVFICLTDPFGLGLPRYTFKTVCLERLGARPAFDDGRTAVVFNCAAYDKLAGVCGDMLHYIKTRSVGSERIQEFDSMIEDVKSLTYERGKFMFWSAKMMDFEYDKKQAELRGREEGQAAARLETARNLRRAGIADKTIAECTGLTQEQVQAAFAAGDAAPGAKINS